MLKQFLQFPYNLSLIEMSTEDDLRKEAIAIFYEKHENDLLDQEKCKEIVKLYENDIKRIKAELNLKNEKSEITQAVISANQSLDDINKTSQEVVNTINQITEQLNEIENAKTELENYFKQLDLLDCTLQYMNVVKHLEFLSSELETHIKNKDDEQATTVFANITEVCRHLANTPAVHLRKYLREIIDHWYKILKNKFTADLEVCLKAINWPFVNVTVITIALSESNTKKLQIVIEYLFQINLPEELVMPSNNPAGILADFVPLSLPIQLLIEPLKKRFLFHFYGSRKTNRIDKPEWYFTKILSWARDHNEFIESWIQPIIDKMGLYHIEAKIEFMRGLVQLAVEKLFKDLQTLQYDDFTFSHCIDEALGFDKELKESYDYPDTQPGVLVVLTQAQVFMKWLSMEKKYALEKMDTMLSDSFNEDFHHLISNMEDFKITPSAEMFITLLQTITERYESLPQPGHRLQFLDLQLELLDDFRVRLLQLLHEENDDDATYRTALIANTAHYVEDVLIDWGSMLHFLKLYYYQSQLEGLPTNDLFKEGADMGLLSDVETETVFANILSLYRHMKKDLLFTLVENVVEQFQRRSKRYRHEMWSNIAASKEIRSLSVTPTACPMFEILATNLHQLQKYLSNGLFTMAWRLIAQHIDTFLFEDFVLETRFNEGGALQLKFDVTRNLFPIFAQFTDKPDSYCSHLAEACALLNVSKGTALLLRETLIALEGATGVEDRRKQALREVGVELLEPNVAVSVLNRRTDITVNRISTID